MCADQVAIIAKRLGVTNQDVVDMNRRLGGDASLNAPIRDDGEAGEWQDWLVDNSPNQEAVMAEHEEFDHRRQALTGAIGVLNPRERRIFEAQRLAEDPMTLEDLAAEALGARRRRAPGRRPGADARLRRRTPPTTGCAPATTRRRSPPPCWRSRSGRLGPDLVLAPLGLTGHVDHLVVERALDELGMPRLRWLDLPYALRRTPGAPLGAGEVVAVPAGDAHLAAKLTAAAAYPDAEPERLAAHAVAEGERLGAGGPGRAARPARPRPARSPGVVTPR